MSTATVELEIPSDIAFYGPEAIARYRQWCETNGGPPREEFQHRLALWFSRKRGAGLSGTDSINFHGKHNGNPFAGAPLGVQKVLAAQAKAMGIPTAGMVYNPSLVRREYAGRFDPEALVGSTGDVKRVLDSHPEWDAEGMVNQTGREPENDIADEPWGVDDRLVEEEVVSDLQSQGLTEIGQKEFADLKEKKHTQLKGDMG